MKKEPRSLDVPRSPSLKTDAVREFLTAMLATVTLSAVALGLVGKYTGYTEDITFSMRESAQEAIDAKFISREYSQEVLSTTGTTNEAVYSDADIQPVPVDPYITPADGTDPSIAPIANPGEIDSYCAELLAQLDAGITPSPRLYIAASQELLNRGAGADAKTIIQSGVLAHPDNSSLALSALDVRAATGDARSVWKELALLGDTTNAAVMSRLIKYATVAGTVDETMTILGNLENLPWTPSSQDWGNLVNMLIEAGRVEDAKEASHNSPEASHLEGKLEAISQMNDGHFKEAEKLLKAYINGIAAPTPEDWALLAEIYEGLGKANKADDNYRKAEEL